MKKLILILALGLSSSVALAYPMSGIDTRFSTGRQSVTLMDRKGARLDLENGHAYRLRLSNASKSLNIMAGGDARQEIKVQGGFPGGDLRNFQVSGAQIGNPGMALKGRTFRENRGESSGYEQETCSWVCGHDVICDDKKCRTIPEYCHGQTVYDVTYVHEAKVFEMALVDEVSAEQLGIFRGDVSNDRVISSRRTVSTSCR